jgi:DNA-binding transcriptional ArsR family regulator
MKIHNYEIFELHANFCKTLANPNRLIIISALGVSPMTVGEISELLGLNITNTSQHLKSLKQMDIVKSKKNGQKVCYSLSDQSILHAVNTIRKIVVELYKQKGAIIEQNIDYDHLISE